MIKLEHISKTFGDTGDGVHAVKDVSLEIGDGEIFGIIGFSGAGKSTLVRCINLLERPTSGSITVNGQKLTWMEKQADGKSCMRTVSPQELRQARKKISMIFQGFNLLMQRTCLKNVCFPMELSGVPKAQAEKKALELLEEVGITDAEKRMKNYPHQLSGGMRQRVVIAIALSCDPDLLICDEPTTALDVTIQAKILELIRRIQKERGISVIYITHDLGVVAKVADYVDVMYAGKIVETGTIDEIFYDPKHPYTWGLLSAMPDLDTADDRLYTIPGSPPNLLHEKPGDAFAPRNRFALNIDDEIDPPMFKISDTHYAATWLLDPRAPKVEMPPELKERIARMKAEAKKIEEAE